MVKKPEEAESGTTRRSPLLRVLCLNMLVLWAKPDNILKALFHKSFKILFL
jgi:hypothetical protein